MRTKLTSIVRVADHDYEVAFDVAGVARKCTCSVTGGTSGLRLVNAVPDVLLTLGLDPRAIAAAVIAFDRVASCGPESDSPEAGKGPA
jgi:hypothetical protein